MIELIALSVLTVALASVFIWQGPGGGLAASLRRIFLRAREIIQEMNYGARRSYELLTSFPQDTDEQLRETQLNRH